MEGVDVGDIFEFLAILLHHMKNKWFDVFPLDKLEKFETGRVEEVVARHGLVNYVQDEAKGIVMRH